MDLDPTEPLRVVDDRRVDDLDVAVDGLDLLDLFEEVAGLLPLSTTKTARVSSFCSSLMRSVSFRDASGVSAPRREPTSDRNVTGAARRRPHAAVVWRSALRSEPRRYRVDDLRLASLHGCRGAGELTGGLDDRPVTRRRGDHGTPTVVAGTPCVRCNGAATERV